MLLRFFRRAYAGDNSLVKYLLTFAAVVLGVLLGNLPLGGLMAWVANQPGTDGEAVMERLDFTSMALPTALPLALVLLPFAVALLILYLCIRFLHRRTFTSALTGRGRLDRSRVWFGFWVWLGVAIVAELGLYLRQPSNYTWQFDAYQFLWLLPVALVLVPLQTSLEEVLFRGYWMQAIGLASRWPWIALVVTSVIFGALHFANPEVGQFGWGIMMVYYIGFGLLLGLFTLLDGGCELALGIHAATNIYGVLFVTFPGTALTTSALFRIQEVDPWLVTLLPLIAGLIFLGVCARKYHWNTWPELFTKIEKQASTT